MSKKTKIILHVLMVACNTVVLTCVELDDLRAVCGLEPERVCCVGPARGCTIFSGAMRMSSGPKLELSSAITRAKKV